MRYTYSRRDNTQDVAGFDPDEVMEALADDLISDGDIWNALQRVIRWGLQQEDGSRSPGLQHLLQRLRSQRQEELERYNLGGMLQDIQEQLDDVVQTERAGISRKLGEARRQEGQEGLDRMLDSIARRKLSFLDRLPEGLGPSMSALADYEFLDEEARIKFEALTDVLRQQVLQSHFENIEQSLRDMTGENLEELKRMLHDLNSLLQDRLDGLDPDLTRFMEEHGRHFVGAESLDGIIEQLQEQAFYTESLLGSMPAEKRRALEALMTSALRDDTLRQELARMSEAMQSLAGSGRAQRRFPFSGEESLTLDEALRLIRRMHELEELEKELRQVQESGDLEQIDADQVRRVMGEEGGRTVEELKRLVQVLEEAGYVQRNGGSLELTARGVRKIGQKALEDIFQHLKRDTFGHHFIPLEGIGGDRADESKRYEFGDVFLLDLSKTLMNSVVREGSGSPLTLSVQDFEVFRTEYTTRSATVLMLDMSRSMPLRGCFVAAKKVAFALNSLIRLQFPRDRLYIVGFSDYARELRPETLHEISWGDYVYGTNMQHGFMLARRLLGRQKTGNKQIILITDGEPTAHVEGDSVQFAYPPTFRTFQETLREVRRCTREGIVINTFMLERSHYLADFVNQMTRINRGRAFFTTPDRLGDYILVDYVRNKRNTA